MTETSIRVPAGGLTRRPPNMGEMSPMDLTILAAVWLVVAAFLFAVVFDED